MEPDGGGEIYFSCEPVKFTKAIQAKLIYTFLIDHNIITIIIFIVFLI